MTNENKQDHLEKILNFPGLEYKKLSKYRYLLHYRGRRWFLWPKSGRYQNLSPEGVVSEMFIGELKEFYHRYLTEQLQLPENFGKVWSKDDEDLLHDMIDHACTLRQIAAETKRHPSSVVTKLSKYLSDATLHHRLDEEMYDVPIAELVNWKT